MIDSFIEKYGETIYERIVDLKPEMIPNDEWLLEEHPDEVQEFIFENMKKEFNSYVRED